MRKRILGLQHFETLKSMEELSSKYCMKNRLLEVEELQKQVVKIKREIFGNDHLDTVSSISGLAFILYEQGRKEEA